MDKKVIKIKTCIPDTLVTITAEGYDSESNPIVQSNTEHTDAEGIVVINNTDFEAVMATIINMYLESGAKSSQFYRNGDVGVEDTELIQSVEYSQLSCKSLYEYQPVCSDEAILVPIKPE